MAPSPTQSLSREELYNLVWSTPIRTLAPQFNLSDVGLAKVCKKHDIPRPSLGYWARLQHGQKLKKPPLPAAPSGTNDVIEFEARPTPAEVEKDLSFLDADLAGLASKVESGEIVAAVATTLRGCHALTGRTRDYLEYKPPRPRRDQWGIIEQPARYEGSHVHIGVSKALRHRALVLLDAAVKTLQALGCRIVEPTDRWNRTVDFELKGATFGVRITERNRQTPHVLTKEEEDQKRRTGRHWGPTYDHVTTGELRLELAYAGSGSYWSQFKDGKRAKVEEALPRFALAVLRHADDLLKHAAAEKERVRVAAERARLAREEEARQQHEEALRKAEAARRSRLLELANAWEQRHILERFLSECRQRLTKETLGSGQRELVERLTWADAVLHDADPFRRGVTGLPAFTHPDASLRSEPAGDARTSPATAGS